MSVGASAASRWTQVHAQRLDWGFRARDKFVASLSKEVQARLAVANQGEAYVVVFGQTQVGKTSLLLDLMGILPEHMDSVSEVLRGGRRRGDSATATTMEYRRSDGPYWMLQRDGGESMHFADDAAMTAALAHVRADMERRKLPSLNPCVVSIPSNCFTPLQPQEHAIRMLDLPGDRPANRIEQEHVHALAHRWVPAADLILLVGKVNSLGFLQKGGLTLPGIEHWQIVPARFRVVTTYTFTAASMREWMDREGMEDPAAIRGRLIQQIERFAPLSAAARRPELFFPLEFGRSWASVLDSDPEFHRRVSPLITHLKRQLFVDIAASTTPEARLRAMTDVHVVIGGVKENRERELQAARDELTAEVDKAVKDLATAQGAHARAAKLCAELRKRSRANRDADQTPEFAQAVRLVVSSSAPEPDKKVSAFQRAVVAQQDTLRTAFRKTDDKVAALQPSAFWREVRRYAVPEKESVERELKDAFCSFETHLSSYSIDGYWTSISGSYQEDRNRLLRCIDEAQSALDKLSRVRWERAVSACRDGQESELTRAEGDAAGWEMRALDLKAALHKLQAAMQRKVAELEEFSQRISADLAESRRFQRLLDAEYLRELRTRRSSIASQPPAAAFTALLGAVHLKDVRKRILVGSAAPEAKES